jgi:Tol biopolymer transport system component
MQVLTALADARNAVVSRDHLIQACWNGRIVGDDAINRCIGKVRKLATLTDPPAFTVETVPRVGYRLLLPGAAPSTRMSSAEPAETAVVPEPTQWLAQADQSSRTFRHWRMAALVVALLAGAVTGAIWMSRREPQRWVVTHSEMLVAADAIQRWPAISPDGSLIAYAGGNDIRSRQIRLRPIAGGESLALTDGTGDAYAPAWSADGHQLAYAVAREDTPCRLMVRWMPAGSPREVGSCAHAERTEIAWGPSGNELLFTDRPALAGGARIMRLDLATGQRRQLTHPADGDVDDGGPATARDRHAIAFQRCRGALGCRLFTVASETGEERQLDDTIDPANFSWAEDSRSLFVGTQQDGDFALWSWPLDGGKRERIMSSPRPIVRSARGPHGLLAIELNDFASTLAAMSASDAQEPRLLAPERGQDCASDIAPDGTIAVLSNRSGGAGVWLLSRDGAMRRLVELPSDSLNRAGIRWSPDGKLIAISTSRGAELGIRVVTAGGAEVAFIPADGDDIATPAWSTGAAAVLFPVHAKGVWRVWRGELAVATAPKPLPLEGWREIRRDGDTLYGVRDSGPGVWRIDDAPRQLTPFPDAAFARQWVIDDGQIYYPDTASYSRRVLAQPIAGGPSRVAGYASPRVSDCGFSIDPLTKAIVYPQIRYFNSDIELLQLARQ